MATKTGEYKGSPTISLIKDENDKFPFSFGVKKAQMIIENIDAIVEFVNANTKKS